MATLIYSPDLDIVTAATPALVNTVNCVGVMGAGVALRFKQRWPSIMPPYQAACRAGEIRPGHLWVRSLDKGQLMVAMATKDHWRQPSHYGWVLQGLVRLKRFLETEGLPDCALPPPGCGHGGLEWSVVHEMVELVFDDWQGTLQMTIEKPEPNPAARAKILGSLESLVRPQQDEHLAGTDGPPV